MARTALVADADPAARRALREALAAEGFSDVRSADHGSDLAAQVRQARPDLVVLGRIAEPDAQSLCRELKLDARTTRVPVVLILGPGEPMTGSGLRVIANGYLAPSLTADEVRRVVRDSIVWRQGLEREGVTLEVTFQLRSEPAPLEELTRVITDVAARCGVAPTHAKHLGIAVREIGMNAIEWGHGYDADRLVTVVLRECARHVTVVIRDTGRGFDPADLPHAARVDDPISHLSVRDRLGLRDGGFGLLIARGLVDDLSMNESGNEVRLVKYCQGVSAERDRPEPAAS